MKADLSSNRGVESPGEFGSDKPVASSENLLSLTALTDNGHAIPESCAPSPGKVRTKLSRTLL